MIVKILWWMCIFIIVEAMVGYPISLLILDKIFRKNENEKNYSLQLPVTIMIVAHNEEQVIYEKLNNVISIDYPKDKIKIIVTSDFSTDKTCAIVKEFIKEHPEWNIRLHETKEHFGKTNAQNEAQELVDTEILIMTDANAMIDKSAVKELVASFTSDDIAYVTGQLKYTNSKDNSTAGAEGFYWKMDLICREIESKFQTITAGNGALYACRNKYYVKLKAKSCHDSGFPLYFALHGKRAIYNKEAIAYEKAGEVDEDEFKRKVRMNRGILHVVLPDIRLLNLLKNKWFSYFYFGHRTCRYLLWITHFLVFALNILLVGKNWFWNLTMILQILFYVIATIGWNTKCKNRWIKMITYYCMTIIAQWKGVFNILTGNSKAVWEKAESTR